ncbi:MAG: hypothetical protein AB7U81_02120 [Thiohalomonadaceae bacterium]
MVDSASPLTGLEAGIVPHRTWFRRQWFQGEGTRYYHRPRPLAASFAPDADFYERVDPLLRDICRHLHGRGLRTAPSCEGHFHGRAHFERLWDELQREARAITGAGLIVRDAENGRSHLFRDPRYRLPWQRFEQFFGESIVHQAWGYLGIIIPRQQGARHARLRAALREMDDAQCAFEPDATGPRDAWLLHVLVQPRDPADAARRWRGVAEWLAQVT